jgi:hypothetical protein
MKNKNLIIVAAAMLGLTVATFAQTPSQQWITTLNQGSSSVDAYDGCGFSDVYGGHSPKISISSGQNRIGVAGISGCLIYCGVLDAENGNTLFNSTYTNTGNNAGQTIVSDANNNFVLGGLLDYGVTNAPLAPTALLWKVNANNTTSYQIIQNSYTQNSYGKLASDNLGNIYAYSHSNSSSTFQNHVLRKYNPTGGVEWTSTIDDYDWYYGYPGRMTIDPAGNIIFTGKRQISGPAFYDIVIRKVNSDGVQLWQKYYNIGEDYINDITTDTEGNVYFTMEVRNAGNKVVKLDGSNGNELWSTQYSETNQGALIKINANGDVLVGFSQTKAFDANSGVLIWTSSTQGYILATDSNSKIYAVSNNIISILNSDGTLADNITVDIPNFTVTLRDITISGNSIYVTGKRANGNNSKIIIAKYNTESCENNTSISPQSNSLSTGNTATFNASTSDPNPSFIWQSDFGQGFQTLNNIGNYSGINTETLNIANIQLPNHTQPIRVISTSGNCIDTSNVAVINILDTCFTNITVYDTLLTTVTDTLVINSVITSINPPNNQNTLKVFPNPTSTHITIDYGNFNAMIGYTLTIVNSTGQTVFTSQINQQSSYIDLSTWTGAGIYFVQLIDPQNNTIENRKIVIQ